MRGNVLSLCTSGAPDDQAREAEGLLSLLASITKTDSSFGDSIL
jgi:hypothetical protein